MSAADVIVALPFALFAAAGGYFDLRTRTIPNRLSAAFAILGLATVWYVGGGGAAGAALAHSAIALGIGMLVYVLGAWGGGDAKFYAASAAWFELSDLPRLMLGISLAGLVLVVGWFAVRRIMKSPKTHGRKGELPYGVAIAAGGIATMASQFA